MKTLYLAITLVFLISLVIPSAYSQSNNCEKKITDVSYSILNSIDKQKAISIAVNDTDFRDIIGNSRYIVGIPSVESERFNQLDCRLINLNIQIQFNVLSPNADLSNCPYVIVIEDSSAPKVLAVDLGSCSTAIGKPYDSPIAESSSFTILIIGGIVVSVVVGISFFVMRIRK
jgi:hypothetical protein